MGRLTGLELCNFKSYKGIVKVGFGDSNFTSIIGPNGSGKSNMMDAISFVLGVRSSHLRSNILKDLIYRGIIDDTNTGNDSDSDSDDNHDINHPKFAYVKAFYQIDTETTTTELMRKITMNGDTVYKINDKQVTFNEYSSFLENQNILIKAKNFLVFQGDVEQIASQSPMDLTKLFEQVSGSIQYKKEYDELKDQLDTLNNSTIESIKNRKRIHNELKTYKDGMNKDEQYKSAVLKKNDLQKKFMLWELYHLDEHKNSLLNNLDESKLIINELKEKIQNEELSLKRSKQSFTKDNSILLKGKNKLDFKIKERERIISDLKLIKLPQRATSKRINNIEKRLETLNNELERQSKYVERFENQLKVVTNTKEAFEKNLQKTNTNYNKYKLNDDELKLYESLNEKYLAEGGGSLIEEKIALNENDRNELMEEMKRYEKRIDIAKARINDELMINLEKNELENSELTSALNEKNSLNSDKLKELKFLQSEIESMSNQEYDLNYKLRETLVKIDDLNANQRETLRERKSRENVAMLKRLFPGVKGLVHDLCRPKKDKYEVAVSTVLGRNFDSIIVENVTVAQECIAYMKKQRAGVASFIPLDTVDSEIPNIPMVDLQGYVLAKNTIEYEREFERAMQYVYADSIICDDLELAKKLKWEYGFKSKLVTLEGGLIHKAGLMTGGISKNGNNRWDKEEYQSLMTLKDDLLQKIENVSTQGRTASIRARDLENAITLLNSEIASVRTQLTQINRAIEENKVELKYQNDLIDNEYSPKIDSLAERRNTLEEVMKKLVDERKQGQSVIFREFTEKVGFTVHEYERHSGEIMRKQNKELQQLQKEILNVENKIQFEKERLESTKKRFEKAKLDLVKAKEEFTGLENKENEYNAKSNVISDEITEQEEAIMKSQEVLDAKQYDINKLEENLNELQLSMQSDKHKRDEIREDIEKLNIERLGILKNCKISNIELPVLSETSLDDVPLISTEEEGDGLSIANKIDIDFNDLADRYKENSSNGTRQELENNIKDVEELLQILQPNARAAERFDEAQDRFNEVDNETHTLKSQEKKIQARYITIKKKRKELFENTFEHVSQHLDGIYRELTRNPNSSAELSGGNASLTLEDEDEPFNAGIRYHATPPLKRFKDMEYLSGGEKTVAALALLFAINSYHPSPFFVLDEVDAALDVRNVERIAAYIRRHGNPDLQFIVISLKNTMFEKSDALVGVYKQQQENSSRIVTLDLTQYAE